MKKIVFSMLLLPIFMVSQAQNNKVQALLIYNFTKYLYWPDSTDEKFKIGVFGNDDFLIEMKIVAKNFKVCGKDIEVLEFNSVEDIKECKILYVIEEKNTELERIIQMIEPFPSILITENAKKKINEQDINFTFVEGIRRFEIFPENIANKNIIVQPELLEMAIVKYVP